MQAKRKKMASVPNTIRWRVRDPRVALDMVEEKGSNRGNWEYICSIQKTE
jgi:hypothetical protein